MKTSNLTMYVYNTVTMEVVAEIVGENEVECECLASAYLGDDLFASTYSPAFGFTGGLNA